MDQPAFLLLDPSAKEALVVSGNASVLASDSTAVVNSKNASAVGVEGHASINVGELDIVGSPGTSISGQGKIVGTIHAGIAPQVDPLSSLPVLAEPNPHFNSDKFSGDLYPGTYEKGIQVSSQTSVTLHPGAYYLKGGLEVSGQATVRGDGVTLYISPRDGEDGLEIAGQAVVSLSPPTSGAYKGITLFQARASGAEVEVLGNGTLNLIGTVYAAHGKLEVAGNGQVNGGGDSVHLIGSQFIGYDMDVEGNGRVLLDARYFNSLTLTANLSPTSILLPDGTLVTNARSSTVTGKTNPLATVSLETNGDSLFDEGSTTADASGNYSLPVTLTEGPNTLRVRATASGQQAIQTIQVTLDTVAPTITVTSPAPGLVTNQNVTMAGQVTDDRSGVAALQAALDSGSYAVVNLNTNGAFSFATALPLDHTADGTHTEHLKAIDNAGNVSLFDVSFTLDTVAPSINITSPLNQTTNHNVTITGQVTDDRSGVASLQAALDGGSFAAVNRNSDGTFSLTTALPLDHTADGPHTEHLRATDRAGNVSTSDVSFTLDTVSPAVSVTSPAPGLVTNRDVTITGQATDDRSGVVSLEELLDSGAFAVVSIDANGNFSLPTGLPLDGSADGPHTVRLRATDRAGNVGNAAPVNFTLDTIAPAVDFHLDPAFDTPPVGDGHTEADTATLTGVTEPNTPVVLQETGARTTSDPTTGSFSFTGVALALGDNTITVQATDPAGNTGSAQHTITRDAGGTRLVEGTRFLTPFEQTFVVPDQPSKLEVRFDGLNFDMRANFIKDAFEASLIDADGNSLVLPITGSRDAFLNITEGQAPVLSPNAQLTGDTVDLDLSHIAAGTQARLRIRLVNNDSDTTTSVIVRDVQVIAAAMNTPGAVTPAATAAMAANRIDFTAPADVTTSMTAVYGQTSFNEKSDVLFGGLALKNTGSYPVDAPLVAVITHLSDPSVHLRNGDGSTPDGLPFFDLSESVAGSTLAPGQSTGARTLAFFDPQGVPFTYDLVILSHLNRPPAFTSEPYTEAIPGAPYVYQATAADADQDTLSYSIVTGPAGMTVDRLTGKVTWNPQPGDLGNQAVLLQVDDGHGGSAQQQYTVATITAPPNRPPVFTSTPVVDAQVNTAYSYQAQATDADGDALTFALVNGPAGMTVSAAGLVSWRPTGDQVGDQNVVLGVDDGHGGAAVQAYRIALGQEPGNTAPVIVSTPVTVFDVPRFPNPPSGDVSPGRIDLNLVRGQTTTQTVSLTMPPLDQGKSFADVVFVVDESGSMQGEHAWLENMVLELDAELQAHGIGPNRYLLVGFGGLGIGENLVRVPGHLFNQLDDAALSLFGPTSGTALGSTTIAKPLPNSLLDTTPATSGTHVVVLSDTNGTTGGYSFRMLTPPVTTTPLTLGSVVSGSIDVPGEEDRYTFTLDHASQLYFDSLSNKGGIQWTLTGPAGTAVNNRNFISSRFWGAGGDTDSTPLNLVAGDYTLTVSGGSLLQGGPLTEQGPTDETGPYSFRLSDLAAATPRTPGTPVSGSLDPAIETNLYKFTAAAGDRFYFDLTARTAPGNSVWKLFDPYGNQLFFKPFNDTTLSDVDVLTLAQPGDYTLMVEGAITDTDPGTYTFNVQPAPIKTMALTLGDVVSGALATAGKQDQYTFTLPGATQLYFDSFTNILNLTWTLTGPAGTSASSSFAGDVDSALPNLPAGDYTLTIDLPGEQTGAYSFRLSDLAAATPLIPGTPVSGSLSPANETDLYKFTAAAGDHFYFDAQAHGGTGSASWRLIDPVGNILFQKSFDSPTASDVDVLTLALPGTYTVLMEGFVGDTGTGTYTFNVSPSAITSTPLALGSTVSGTLATAGSQDRYTFTLPGVTLLYFDVMTSNSPLTWTLVGPAGTAAGAHNFTDGMVRVPAGDYTLTIDAPDDQTGAYAFRLWDLAQATALTPGTPVSGELNPANETDLYQFTAAAGDRFFFDLQSRTNPGNSLWRLIDPYGNAVFNKTFNNTTSSDVGPTTLTQPGVYTLLLEGEFRDTVPGTYTFVVVPQGNSPPAAPPPSTPLTLGSTVNASISVLGEQDRYSFTLAGAALLYFDALTNNGNFNWTLTGPAGAAVTNRPFTTDTGSTGNPVVAVPAGGDYVLTLAAANNVTGNYSFRLNALAAAALTPGTPVSGDLNPANETDLYKFTAAAGDRFYFDVQARTNAGASLWQLIDPYGNVVFTSSFANTTSDVEGVAATQPGQYTLLLEGALSDTVPGSYTINVQPSPIRTAALTLGSTVNSSISATGARDRYTFTLPGAGMLYFDALTNNDNFNWTLTGPTGTVVNARSFTRSDAFNIDNGVGISVPAGDYALTVAAVGTTTGNYSFRLSTYVSATPLTPGTPVSGSLSPANETDLYKFTAAAGDRFFFDMQAYTGGLSTWRLVDPYGNFLFSSAFSVAAQADVDVLTLAQPGTYTLLLEGAIDSTVLGSYTFNVQPAPIRTAALTLGSTVNASLATAGAQDHYTFTLAGASLLYFDGQVNNANFNWTLTGPAGIAVDARNNNSNFNGDDYNRPPLRLPGGDYTLTIDAVGDATGPYAFRLSDMSSVTPLTPGTPVSGSLDPGLETDLYRFTAAAGDRYFFDVVARSGTAGAIWRLIDPYGNVLFTNSFNGTTNADVDVMTLAQPGTYTLLLEGATTFNTGTTGTYTINVQPAPINMAPLTLGDRVSDAISVAGEQDRYTFTLGSASRLYFDSLTNSTSLSWSLDGPTGTVVSNRALGASDGFVLTSPVLSLAAGDYALTIDAVGDVFGAFRDATGAYSFRLSDLAAAAPLTPGTSVSGTLSPANETDLYRFDAMAGDSFYFDVQARTGASNASWRLIDPLGAEFFHTTFNNITSSDVDTLTLGQTGTYTLMIEGNILDTGSGSYTFNVRPAPVNSVPLTLGNQITDAIAGIGEQNRYTFTLPGAALLYFDSLTNNASLTWTLTGPAGTAVSNRPFNSDSSNSGNVFNLPAGAYTLTIDGTGEATGPYAFRLWDLAQATALTPATPVSGSLSPATETDLYRFTANAGDRFYFDVTARTAPGFSTWRLVDPYGNNLFSKGFVNPASDVDVLTLAQPGTYTLLVEGAITDTTPGTYTFNVQPALIRTAALTLGTVVNGAIATAGGQDQYAFTLPGAARLYFDSLTNNHNLTWTLAGPAGTAVSNRAFDGSDGAADLNLPAGAYTLTIDGTTDATGAYSFRLSDLASATPLVPGTPVSGTLDPGNETDLYRFTAAAGDRFFFDVQARSGTASATWRLIDPYDNVLFNSNFINTTSSDVDALTLAQPGTYTLLLEGSIFSTSADTATYTFNVSPTTITSTPLTLGSLVNGSLATPGEQDRYTFTLPAAALLYFDALTNNGNLTGTLTGPAGTAVSARSFTLSENAVPVINVPAGDYTLTIDLPGDATGAYAFRLWDLAQATALTPGTPVSGTLDPANETDLYQFTATAGDRFSFDLQARTNGGGSHWRLLDPYGNIVFNSLFSDTTSSDVGTTTLPQPDRYTLLLEGAIFDTGSGSYTFVVVPQGNSPPAPPPPSTPLVLGSTVNGSISAAGKQDRYGFTLAGTSLLYFDALTSNSNFNWTLTGPAGTAVNGRGFIGSDSLDNSGSPVVAVPAGDYVLTVAASNSATGNYSFRLSTLSSATPLTPGTPVSGSLDPANETDLYRFTANAGDRFFFDVQARANGGTSVWRLIDPYGNVLFSTLFNNTTSSDVDVLTLAQPGTYILLLEGRIFDTSTGTYTVNVQPAPVNTAALTLGSTVNGVLATAGKQDRYTFTLPTATMLYFDALTNNFNLNWTLTGPAGTAVTNRPFTGSDFDSSSNPVVRVPAGDYTLTIDLPGDQTGAYSFRLSDLASATPLTPGTPVSGSLDPANETDLYRFNANAGDRFFFDVVARTNGGNSLWRLIDPYGNIVFASRFASTTSDVDVQTLAQPGTYTLLLEGNLTDTGTGTYTVNVQPAPGSTTALALGSTVNGSLATAGDQDRYTFTLPGAALLYFDSLTSNLNFNWTLTGPSGTVVANRSFVGSDGNGTTNPVVAVPAGDYTLTIDGTGDATGAYTFRLWDVAQATALTPGTPASGSLSPANETDLYRFTAKTGDRFFFDLSARTNPGGSRWRLIDPYGNLLFSTLLNSTTSSDVDVLTLAQPGTYTLLLEGDVNDTVPGSYTINAQPVTFSSQPLTLDNPVSAALSVPGEQDNYTFTGTAGQRIFFDGMGPAANITAHLFAPSGATVFSAAANANAGPLFLQETGSYRLNFDAAGDITGAYGFHLYDVANAPQLPTDQNTTGILNPLESNLYLVDAAAGQKLVFVAAPESFVGTAQQLSATAHSLQTIGGFEDGYDGIDVGLNHDGFRPGAAINAVLITDEDRDTLDPGHDFASTFTELDSRAALLNSVINGQLRDGSNRVALGVDSTGTAYLADGAGGFTTATGGHVSSAFVNTKADYIDLAWAVGGAAWDLNQLRAGGVTAESFTKAFVQIKAHEIEEQLKMEVVASDPSVNFQNLTGVLTGIGAGKTATFDTQMTVDGAAHSFDLLFTRPGSNVILGSIPVTINNDYVYPVRAVDADGDPITFSLAEAPTGATIDPQTGKITWEPPAAGKYHFVVQADDGRGGRGTQEYDVNVTGGAPDQPPAITSTAPTQATAGLPFAYPVTATDPDGDLLAYYLTQAPDGMAIDRTTGSITWKPTLAQIGPHDVAVRVLDGRGGETTQTFTLLVVPDTGNRAPSIVSAPVTAVNTGELYRYVVAATDPDGDALTLDLVVKPDGMTFDPGSGVVAWRPGADDIGEHRAILRVRDGRGGVNLQSWQVTVSPVGTAPVFSTPPPTAPAVVGLPYGYHFGAQDADGDTLTFRLTTAPDGMTIDPVTGILSWTPTAAQVGDHPVTVIVVDTHDLRASLPFTITAVATATNDRPTIRSTPRTSIRLGETYLYQIAASDPNNDPLTYTLVTPPAGLKVDGNGLVSWQPDPSQLGDHLIQLRVSDGRGGTAAQEFTLRVVTTDINHPPVITSTPPRTGTFGRPFVYDLTGSDPDGDPLFWGLDAAPRGMSLNASLGTLRWTPAADQVGTFQVVARLVDGQGAFSTQAFPVVVRGVNLPPAIITSPPTQGAAGQDYFYELRALDPDGDTLTYALTTSPAGMAINPTTGLIAWTPTEGQTGPTKVAVLVTDGQGGSAAQTFTLVVAAPINRPPTITTAPVTAASAGLAYSYDAGATDPEGDALTFALPVAPAGMTIDPTTGVITWTPADSQVGSQLVVLSVTDTAGNSARQIYAVRVQPANRPPAIDSAAVLTATAGQVYRYDVSASDPDGNDLTYRLDTAPPGMGIDPLGRIAWATTLADVGSHPVTVVVTDSFGASVSQSYDLVVSGDTQAPNVFLSVSISRAELGSRVDFIVTATDNVGVTDLVLTVNGTPLLIDPTGRAVFTADQVGAFDVAARASDAAGNTQTAHDSFTVFDPANDNPPVLDLTSPSADATITAPTEVRGTVTDSDLLFYTLSVASVGSTQFTDVARGTSNVTDGVLGTLDPTLLLNDSYILRLEATDAGGHTSSVEQQVSIKDNLKLGNFTLSFTDLTVPVSGIPISVTRTYDTLTAAQDNGLGFGWRLEFRDVDVRSSVAPRTDELAAALGFKNPFRDGTRIYITLPGGQRQGFTFHPQLNHLTELLLEFASEALPEEAWQYDPVFMPDPGVTSKLTLSGVTTMIRDASTGEYFSALASGHVPFNPADSLFEASYTLTTHEGIAYDIDAPTGKLQSVRDTNGNTLTFTEGGVTSSTGVSVTFERDAQGRIGAVVDPQGNRISYQYDATGNLVAVTDRTGNTTQFGYRAAPAHYLEKVIDPLGRTGVRNEYDAQGRLSKVIDAAGNPVQLAFDPTHLLSTVTDRLGNKTTEEYDDRGNAVRTIDALGGVTLRTFDADSNKLTETDPLGRTSTFTYDEDGHLLTQTDPLGNTTRFTHQEFTLTVSPFSRLKTSTDALGNTTRYTYDGSGNQSSMTDPAGNTFSMFHNRAGNAVLTTDANGNTTQFGYDTAGRPTLQVDALGHAKTATHDANGNVLTITSTLTGADGAARTLTTSNVYDAEGRLIAVTDAEGGVTRMEYDAAGNMTARTDPLGRRTEYRFDERNKLVETILPDATPEDLSDNPRVRSEYDAAGRETARIDELGRRTEYEYDALGRLVKTIYPDDTPSNPLDNPFVQVEYDAAGQVTARIDERGARTESEYDAAGHEIVSRDALGNSTLFVYDAAGRKIAETDALGHTTVFVYDATNQLIEIDGPDGTKTTNHYDANGQVVAVTDALNRTTRYELDPLGHITAVVDALNQRTELSYDEAGNRIRQKDANGHVTTYGFDGFGRQTSTTLPALAGQQPFVSTTRYDAAGNVISTTDFNGQTTTMDYDERDRLIAKHYPDGTELQFTYTATGQRATETDTRGTTRFTYDARGELVARTDPDGTTISYGYDAAGNRTAVTTAAGVTTYTFDLLGHELTVTDPHGGVTHEIYDAAGNLIRTELPDGTVETRRYDSRNRLTALEVRDAAGGVISGITYILGPTGRRDSVIEDTGRRVDYSYDALDRLTQEKILDAVFGDRTIDYAYDAVGNRVSRADSAEGTTTYDYDAMDQLQSETLAGHVTRYTYDRNGNMLSRVGATDQVFYTWDFENRLLGADTNGDGTADVTNHYNADGIRVAQTDNGVETRFLVDTEQAFPQVLLEYRPSGLILASYVYGNRLISQDRAGQESFYHVDGAGSTIALTDGSGRVTDRYIYDAFGRTVGLVGDTPNTYLFVGQQRDRALDMDYLRARYLHVDTGRFVSRDPLWGRWDSPPALHPYVYANANPVNAFDPSGKETDTLDLAVEQAIEQILINLPRAGNALLALTAALAVGCMSQYLVERGLQVLFVDIGDEGPCAPDRLNSMSPVLEKGMAPIANRIIYADWPPYLTVRVSDLARGLRGMAYNLATRLELNPEDKSFPYYLLGDLDQAIEETITKAGRLPQIGGVSAKGPVFGLTTYFPGSNGTFHIDVYNIHAGNGPNLQYHF
jgi:RHS repeat-associated protein